MAKKSVIARQHKRELLIKKYAAARNQVKSAALDVSLSSAERLRHRARLEKMVRDGAQNRSRNRCFITGRPRGVMRMFGVGRTKLRELAMFGNVPGLTKSSW